MEFAVATNSIFIFTDVSSWVGEKLLHNTSLVSISIGLTDLDTWRWMIVDTRSMDYFWSDYLPAQFRGASII